MIIIKSKDYPNSPFNGLRGELTDNTRIGAFNKSQSKVKYICLCCEEKTGWFNTADLEEIP